MASRGLAVDEGVVGVVGVVVADVVNPVGCRVNRFIHEREISWPMAMFQISMRTELRKERKAVPCSKHRWN